MGKNLFISNSSYDIEIVKILAEIIKKVSLNQINIWFSNDQEAKGGVTVGENWFQTIVNNLRKSQAIVSLITPNSKNNPWVLYESGFAEALERIKIIPLKFLISINEVSTPLQQKQIFSFSKLDEANIFLKKVLGAFNIVYDEEIFQGYVSKQLEKMRDSYKSKEDILKKNAYELLSEKMDNYFELILNTMSFNSIDFLKEYEVLLEFVNSNGNNVVEYIKIKPSLTVSDVLDSVFYILNGKVLPYKYLETWIIKEKETRRYLVISDVQNLILAKDIFRPNTKWEVEFLDKPYSPDNSFNAKFNKVKKELHWFTTFR